MAEPRFCEALHDLRSCRDDRQAQHGMFAGSAEEGGLRRSSRAIKQFYSEATDFGIRSGVSVPIRTSYGRTAMITLKSDQRRVEVPPWVPMQTAGDRGRRRQWSGCTPLEPHHARAPVETTAERTMNPDSGSRLAIGIDTVPAIGERTTTTSAGSFRCCLPRQDLPHSTKPPSKCGVGHWHRLIAHIEGRPSRKHWHLHRDRWECTCH